VHWGKGGVFVLGVAAMTQQRLIMLQWLSAEAVDIVGDTHAWRCTVIAARGHANVPLKQSSPWAFPSCKTLMLLGSVWS
jgi:hypothetical protein